MVGEICELCKNPLLIDWNLADFFKLKATKLPLICQACRQSFQKIAPSGCKFCRGRLKAEQQICHDCLIWQKKGKQLFINHALYQYNETMRQYFQYYKFQGGYHLNQVFKNELQAAVQAIGADLIVPIPISANTYLQRGFNQVIGLLADLELHEYLVCKADKRTQVQKSRIERLKSSQPFFIVERVKKQLSGKKVCLVDDVYTTGTTLHHAAKLLSLAGARTIYTVTLAR